MPFKPRRPCRHPGCPALVDRGFCATHDAAHDRETTRRAQEYDKARGTAAERGYDGDWREASRKYLRDHPYCECDACRSSFAPHDADTVDHIVPHNGDLRLFWDRSNWRAMSWAHHSRKTASSDGGFGNRSIPRRPPA